MTRVLHTGDTHLGYTQYHLPARRQDFLDAFQQVADDAVADEVDAVVHAGDLFHDRQPTLTDIMGAMNVLRTLDDGNIPFCSIVGNHESKRDRQWLDLFESMGLATRLGREPVVIGDVAIYGLDFVPRSQRDSLEYDFEPTDAAHTALVSHGLFEPFDHGEWDAQAILRESPVAFDTMLLGDDHTPQTRQVEEPYDAWLTYCGSTERASASEREDRGYNLIRFDEGVDIRRRGLDTRQFEFIDLELAAGEGFERVRERIQQADVTEAVLIVTLTGDGEQVLPADVENFADEQGALVARVNDRRELAEETEETVSFADPDEAVRKRIQELGLSPAARDLDETIRASKVPDSNVAETVESHVADLVADADAAVFEGGVEAAESDESSGETASTEEAESTAAESEANHQSADGDTTADAGNEVASATDTSDEPEDPDADAQASMEEYL